MTAKLQSKNDKVTLFKPKFIETCLNTKWGVFNFRVYEDKRNQETIVLWKKDLDLSKPVLLRIHSECITGDTFASLHCDCGKQLQKSLQLISKEGGVLIYLRQEGRGIGLFEKIKAYKLQAEGYDTFEANVILGHRPDERTYNMAKNVLDDLGIINVKLLTNNPSKISELAKLGIHITERIPLFVPPNKYNRKYYLTKKNKFQHSLQNSNKSYFCQFHIDSSNQIKKIADFLKKKQKDPLLQIFAGISTNINKLENQQEQTKIKEIYKELKNYPWIIPVLHFSFQFSKNTIKNAKRLQELLPFVKKIQVNDLYEINYDQINFLSNLFEIDIPVSNENFTSILEPSIRKLIINKNLSILIDNSKGRGIKEDKKSLQNKINILLSHGLNNIGLCGGFGPDELDTYFNLRRFYRINFSIDAETKLKTDGQFDIEKIKCYLHQVLRFDDPNEAGIEQTKQFLKKTRRKNWDITEIMNEKFFIHPKVFHAGYFKSTEWFAQKICNIIKSDRFTFCEIGSGSGVISCLVGLHFIHSKIVSSDINPFAKENTFLNAKRLGLANRVKTYVGDVFDNIPKNQKFDYIFWALPFGFLDPGTNVNLEDLQVFDPGYRAIRKFLKEGKNFLNPNGKLLIGFSMDLGHISLLKDLAEEFNLKLKLLEEKEIKETDTIKFQLFEGTYRD